MKRKRSRATVLSSLSPLTPPPPLFVMKSRVVSSTHSDILFRQVPCDLLFERVSVCVCMVWWGWRGCGQARIDPSAVFVVMVAFGAVPQSAPLNTS